MVEKSCRTLYRRPTKKLASSSEVKRSKSVSRSSTPAYETYPKYNGGLSMGNYFDPSQSDLDRRDYNWENR